MANDVPWTEGLEVAITVANSHGVIESMNPAAQRTFSDYGGGELIGRSLLDCHPQSAQEKIASIMKSGKPNHYTIISKTGQRKIIHQIPWYRDGLVAGIVEMSVPIPEELPHFDRMVPAV